MRHCVRTILIPVIVGPLLVGCEETVVSPPQGSPDVATAAYSQGPPFQNRGFAAGRLLPIGSWRYDWNNTLQQWGRLALQQPQRRIEDIPCTARTSDRPFCGGFTGRSGQRRAFVHMYFADDRRGGVVETVLLFAWGDDDEFGAVVLPNTAEYRELRSEAAGLGVEEAIRTVQNLMNAEQDVFRGRTHLSNYYGSVTN